MENERLTDLLIQAFEYAINKSEQATEYLVIATGITDKELNELGYDEENFPSMHAVAEMDYEEDL